MHFISLGAPCNTPLGLQNGRLRNSRITASSEYNVYHASRLGRLGLHKRGRYVGAWCARHNNKNQWIKVDFGRTMKITKIATQGRQDAAQWVTYYRVSSSLDGVHWQVYRFKNSDKVRKCDRSGKAWPHLLEGWIIRSPVDKCYQSKPRYPLDSDLHRGG